MKAGDVVAERYELVSLAASGGTAAVFHAVDRRDGRRLALKLAYSASDALIREAEILRLLDHRAIAGYVDHGSSLDVTFLALEWLDGEDLSCRLSRAGLSASTALAFVREAAEALAHVHGFGVVHGDVKPANLFIVGDAVKLIDFGVAGASLETAERDMMRGTPLYMAPEMLWGTSVGPAADIFSLGVVFYECLTGERPFSGGTLMEVASQVMVEAPAPMHDIDSELERLVTLMLAKEPSDRPTAHDVASQLTELAEKVSVQIASWRSGSLLEERRPTCAAVVHVPGGAVPLSVRTVRMADCERAAVEHAQAVAATFGAEAIAVPGMGLVVNARSSLLLPDKAAVLARFALAIRRALPDLGVGIALRREAPRGRWQFGETVAAAQSLAERALARVFIDEVVAGLLDARFTVRSTKRGHQLLKFDRSGTSVATQVSDDLLGRAAELAELEHAMNAALNGSTARPCLLVGDAGIGKSRLMRQLLRRSSARRDPTTVLMASADPVSTGLAFSVATQLLCSAVEVSADEDRRWQRAAIRVRLDMLGVRELRHSLEKQLCSLMRHEHNEATGLAISQWLAAEAAHRPMLLIIEDAQWSDEATLRAINAVRDVPLFVLLLSRTWERLVDAFDELRTWVVQPLSDEAARRLVARRRGLTTSSIADIVSRGGGNPAHLQQLASAAADGRGVPVKALSSAQQRLDEIASDARPIVRAASVVGTVFRGSALIALLGPGFVSAVTKWLPRLIAHGVFRPHDETGAEPAYAFCSELLREAAYETVPERQRPAAHRLAARWLQRQGAAGPMTVAEHWSSGRAPDRAAESYLDAAKQALAANDFATALAAVERGIACGARGTLLAALRIVAAEACEWRGDIARQGTFAEAALTALTPDRDSWYVGMYQAVSAQLRQERVGDAIRLCEELTAQAAGDATTSARVISLARVAGHLTMSGDVRRGDSVLAGAERAHGRLSHACHGAAAWLAWARAWRACSHGDLAAALEHDIASLVGFEAAGDARNLCYGRSNVGYDQLRLGLYEQARDTFDALLPSARAMGLRLVEASCTSDLGLLLAYLGDHDDALDTQQRAIDMWRELQLPRSELYAMINLARIHTVRGDHPAAESFARLCLDRACDAPGAIALCSAVLAHVLLAQGKHEAAAEEAERASELLELNGSSDGYQLLIHCGYALAMRAIGRDDEARRSAQRAKRELMAVARGIGNDNVRHAFLERVWEHRQILTLAARLGTGRA